MSRLHGHPRPSRSAGYAGDSSPERPPAIHRLFPRVVHRPAAHPARFRRAMSSVHEVELHPVLAQLLGDLVHGVEHGGVVAAAEGVADAGQGGIRELPAQVHGDLSWVDDVLAAPRRAEVCDGHPERGGHDPLDRVDRHGPVAVHGVVQGLAHEVAGERPAGERGEGQDAGQCALELADVGRHAAGDGREHLVARHPEAVRCHALLQDGDARLEVRRLDVGDEPPLEARAQPLLQPVDLAHRPVGGQDDLPPGLVQAVEGVENSSWMRPRPPRNWTSSTSRRSCSAR